MVSSLTETLDTALLSLTVIEEGQETPSRSQLDEVDSVVVSRFGWAFRFGMGASTHLNDYRYGYIVPGVTLNPSTISRIEERVQDETTLTNPTVLMKPRDVSDEELLGMEKLGNLPHEVIDGLQGLQEDVEENMK